MEESNEQSIDDLKKRISELENRLSQDKQLSDQIRETEDKPLFDIYTWTGPDRIVANYSKTWYIVVGVLASLFIFISLLTGNFMLVFAILAIIFLLYIYSTVPAQNTEYAITNKGVRVKDEVFLWKDIDYFWVASRQEQLVINIEFKEMRGRITLLVGNGDVNRIVTEMIQHEDYREPKGIEALVHRITEGEYKKITEFKK